MEAGWPGNVLGGRWWKNNLGVDKMAKCRFCYLLQDNVYGSVVTTTVPLPFSCLRISRLESREQVLHFEHGSREQVLHFEHGYSILYI